MVSVSRTFTVDKPAATVVDYLTDFTNAIEWDPGTQQCERNDDGPIRVGSSWRNVSKFLGRESELTYTLERLEPGRLTFVGRNKTVTSNDDITVRPATSGSEITYNVDVEVHGAAKLGAPLIKREFERLATATEKQLRETLDRL
jgi:carbon monoxide dehydrogenase subunit G